jgi:hypothetical protein
MYAQRFQALVEHVALPASGHDQSRLILIGAELAALA